MNKLSEMNSKTIHDIKTTQSSPYFISEYLKISNQIFKNIRTDNIEHWDKKRNHQNQAVKLLPGFKQIFQMKKDKLSTIDYLTRITDYDHFDDLTLFSGLNLYIRVLFCLKFKNVIIEHCEIKLFAACLSLAQKILLDVGKKFGKTAKLLGFKPKKLCLMEIYLLQNILEYDSNLTIEELESFSNWLNHNFVKN